MMDKDLLAALESIKANHHLQGLRIPWAAVVQKITATLEEISTTTTARAHSQNGPSTSPERAPDADISLQINCLCTAIRELLIYKFSDAPPFTVVRLAEILLQPGQCGYPLTGDTNVLKFFNALSYLVCVSSTVDEFPQTSFADPETRSNALSVSARGSVSPEGLQRHPPADIPLQMQMTPIPWLVVDPPAVLEPEIDAVDQVESPTISARRQRDDTGGKEEETKRPRTGPGDRDLPALDASTDSVLTESERSEVCTPS